MKYEKLMKEAELRVRKMDEIDPEHGFAAPSEMDIETQLGVIRTAMESGIQLLLRNSNSIDINGIDIIAEALVMVKSLELRLK